MNTHSRWLSKPFWYWYFSLVSNCVTGMMAAGVDDEGRPVLPSAGSVGDAATCFKYDVPALRGD
jgi:hypothetical protein